MKLMKLLGDRIHTTLTPSGFGFYSSIIRVLTFGMCLRFRQLFSLNLGISFKNSNIIGFLKPYGPWSYMRPNGQLSDAYNDAQSQRQWECWKSLKTTDETWRFLRSGVSGYGFLWLWVFRFLQILVRICRLYYSPPSSPSLQDLLGMQMLNIGATLPLSSR